MTRKRTVLKSAIVLAGLAGIAAPIAAFADEPKEHYVAIQYGEGAATLMNSVEITNKDRDGGVRCFNISSLTPDGGPFTTTYKVWGGDWVDFNFYRSDNCDPPTNRKSVRLQVSNDDQKYWYVPRVG